MSDARQILKALGSRPIAYHAALAKKLDSVTAALVVCQLMYWDGKGHNADGWTVKKNAEFTDELGMSEHELETARRKCQAAGVVTFERKGMPARGHYRLNWDALEALLSQTESAQQVKRKAPNTTDGKRPACEAGHKGDLLGGKRLTITETTSETTTKTTTERSARASAPRPRDAVFDAVAQITKSNPTLQGSMIAKVANQLKAVGATPEMVLRFGKWWAVCDWRGLRGDLPLLTQITPLWQRSVEWDGARPKLPAGAPPRSNGRTYRLPMKVYTEADRKAAEERAAREMLEDAE